MNNKLLLLVAFILTTVFGANAQAPQQFSYQSVIRDTNGLLITDSNIALQISVLQGSPTGTVIYTETHNITTNTNGLATLAIGNGTVTLGDFKTINWGIDNYFIKTDIDITGGTNYNLTGISQLLSVPFALYSENSKNQGKASIYINGDITEAEVAIKLKKELGPNTDNIIVRNTTILSHLDLSMLTEIAEISIEYNENLTTVDLQNLTTAHSDLDFSENNNLSSINLGNLKTAYSDIISHKNNKLTGINLSTLQKSYSTLSIENCPLLNSLQLDSFTKVTDIIISITALQTIDLQNLNNAKNITIRNNTNLQSILLNNIIEAEHISIINNNIQTINLDNLNNTHLSISNNINLSEINLPNFTNAIEGLSIGNNGSLSKINLPIFSQTTGSSVPYIAFSFNALPSSEVNKLLNLISVFSPITGKSIHLQGQTPSAAPTGQGITDKNTLINQGNTVLTD